MLLMLINIYFNLCSFTTSLLLIEELENSEDMMQFTSKSSKTAQSLTL